MADHACHDVNAIGFGYVDCDLDLTFHRRWATTQDDDPACHYDDAGELQRLAV